MNDKQDIVESEAVPSQAVAVRPSDSGLMTISAMEQSFALAVRQRELLSDYIKRQLVPGKHFYQRGDQKPSLSKEGAEIILLPHNLAPDYELVSGPDTPPENDQPYQITVKCTLRRKGDPGSFVGSGMGSAGSQHMKRDGKYVARQPDKFLCHNATLKMAQKSAMISATINSTAASEFFTQDMEEPPPANVNKPVPKKEPEKQKEATATTREWFLKELGEANVQAATQFCIELGWIMPNEGLVELPLRFVPTSRKQYDSFKECMGIWMRDGKVGNPYLPNHFEGPKAVEVPRGEVDEPGDQDAWRQFPMPFGKNAGIALEDLEKNYLFGLFKNYKVETEYNGRPKKPETIAKDQKLRDMLDLAGVHYEWKHDD
jgi:hypothetical protein